MKLNYIFVQNFKVSPKVLSSQTLTGLNFFQVFSLIFHHSCFFSTLTHNRMNALLTRSCLSCSRTSKFWDIRWARNVGKRCLSLTTKVNSNLYNRNQVNSRLLCKNVSGLLHTRFYSDFPPHEVLALPALSPTMETGTIARY